MRIVISFVFGCVAAVAALMLFLLCGFLYFAYFTDSAGDVAVGWDPVSVRPAGWLLLLPFFALGFWLSYRRKPAKTA